MPAYQDLQVYYIHYPKYLALHDYLAGSVWMFIKDLVKLCIERRSFRKGFTPLYGTAQYSEQWGPSVFHHASEHRSAEWF